MQKTGKTIKKSSQQSWPKLERWSRASFGIQIRLDINNLSLALSLACSTRAAKSPKTQQKKAASWRKEKCVEVKLCSAAEIGTALIRKLNSCLCSCQHLSSFFALSLRIKKTERIDFVDVSTCASEFEAFEARQEFQQIILRWGICVCRDEEREKDSAHWYLPTHVYSAPKQQIFMLYAHFLS